MTTKFGEISIDQILDNEFKIHVLENMITWILTNNVKLPLFAQGRSGESGGS